MFSSKGYSPRRSEIRSAIAYQEYLRDCRDREKQALEPMARPKVIWVERYGFPATNRFQCYVHTVKRNLPDEGYLIAIPLDSRN